MIRGAAIIGGLPQSVDADSYFRYLSGLLLAIGIGFWTTIPEIERETGRFRLLTALVMVGGFGRLLGIAFLGPPSPVMRAALVMELVITPLLCLWQSAIARVGLDRRD